MLAIPIIVFDLQAESLLGALPALATVRVDLLQASQPYLQLCSAPQLMCAASPLDHSWSAMLPLLKPSGADDNLHASQAWTDCLCQLSPSS